MTVAERVELALILVASSACLVVPQLLPARVALGSLLLAMFVLLLLQGLLRDLWLLTRNRRASGPQKSAQCMCVESAVGATGVLAGIVVLGLEIGQPVAMAAWGWALCVLCAAVTGFLIKDFVFEWNPWSIRREKDHLNIVVRWSK